MPTNWLPGIYQRHKWPINNKMDEAYYMAADTRGARYFMAHRLLAYYDGDA